ncbi:MAG: MFS transporter [Symploca sp. SIO1A3]|nr:MFS transporter [Symploca sp. SIO1A3]
MNALTSRLSKWKSPFQLLGESRHFTLFWIGQSLSEIGNRLTGFGLGIWVYQNTHAVAQLSLVLFFTTLPGVLMTPFVGALVDRWNRQRIILISDIVAALITLALALLLLNHNLQIWHTYVSAFFTSVCGSFQMLTKGAVLPMLVPKPEIGRANGLIQLSSAVGQVAAPGLAGLFITYIHLEGLLWIDFSTYFVAFFTLLLIHIPQPDPTSRLGKANPSLIDDVAYGWQTISSKIVLIVVLVFMALHFFMSGMTNVLINPLILSFSSEASFGAVMSVAGAGMVFGSITMSIWGGEKNRFVALLGFAALNGIGLIITGLKPSIPLISFGVFLSFWSLPLILGTNQTIWQTNIDKNAQGRVLSMVGMMTGLGVAFGNLSASPLADRVLEPMLSKGGLLADTVGLLLGTGDGRGIGFLIVIEGLVLLLVSASLYNYHHHFKNLDAGLVDLDIEGETQTLKQLPQVDQPDVSVVVEADIEKLQPLEILQPKSDLSHDESVVVEVNNEAQIESPIPIVVDRDT